jgi:spermidine/putrescine transport system ATP-binding protein
VEFDVELAGVRKSYSGRAAVDGVDLQIRRGELLTLLGPSGCGKTTVLRLIAGFEEPDAGTVRIRGEDVAGRPPYKRNVNTVFQHYSLFPHLSVFDNVAFGLAIRKLGAVEIQSKVERALALVRLSGFEDRSSQLLSGGEMQRVALARALVLEPAVLLLDEPLAALDLKLRKEMQVELKALQRSLGITFLFVTHDQEEALVLSDRIAVLRAGRIEQLGDAASVYERPATRFVADFMGARNFFRCRVERVAEGEAHLLSEGGIALRAAPSEGYAAGAEALIVVRPEKIRLEPPGRTGAPGNRVAGVVLDRLYLGSTTQWEVRINERETVSVHVTNPGESSLDLARGDRVELFWPASACTKLQGS